MSCWKACNTTILIFLSYSHISDADGVSVELTPLKVKQKVGETVRFTCTYHGSEPMAIDFQEIRRPQRIVFSDIAEAFMGPPDRLELLEGSNRRYKNTDEQSVDIVITPDLTAVKCRILSVTGIEVAMVRAHITKGLNFVVFLGRASVV